MADQAELIPEKVNHPISARSIRQSHRPSFLFDATNQVEIFDHGIVWLEFTPVWILLSREWDECSQAVKTPRVQERNGSLKLGVRWIRNEAKYGHYRIPFPISVVQGH